MTVANGIQDVYSQPSPELTDSRGFSMDFFFFLVTINITLLGKHLLIVFCLFVFPVLPTPCLPGLVLHAWSSVVKGLQHIRGKVTRKPGPEYKGFVRT